jgi:hypothetical protein
MTPTATNGAIGDSASAISVRDKAIDGSDEKALSTVTFLIAEINRLAEEISVRSNGDAKAIDCSDEKALSALTVAVTEINRLAEENRKLKRSKDKYNDVEAMLLIAGVAAVGGPLSTLRCDSTQHTADQRTGDERAQLLVK